MIVRSIRRIVADSNHNMDTIAAFFRDALFVTYRQGDAHVSDNGKVLVIRSRDEGVTFEQVALFRGRMLFGRSAGHLQQSGQERGGTG